MSETVTINSRDTLSGIVQQKYHLKGWSNIQAKCEEIKLFNNQNNSKYQVNDIGKILAGQTLVLPDDTDTVTSPISAASAPKTEKSDSSAETPAPTAETPAATEKPAEDNLGKKFDDWADGCAASFTGKLDDNGKPTFEYDVSPFNMARTPEFKAAVATGNQEEAGKIYKENVEALASSIVDNADTDGDGKLSVQEFAQKELGDARKRFGDLSPEDEKTFLKQSARQFAMMDLDLNKDDQFVDKKEYAAFLYAMDATDEKNLNNNKKIANGEITRDELMAVSTISESDAKTRAIFKGREISSYKGLYGNDPSI